MTPAPQPGAPNRYTLPQVQWLAKQVGFPDPALAAAIAWAESAGDASARGDSGNSLGLWQVNLPAHPEYNAATLLNPIGNARAAFAISQHGADWSLWTTYRTGAWRPFYQPGSVPA